VLFWSARNLAGGAPVWEDIRNTAVRWVFPSEPAL
jgi:hypothetical protein